MTEQDPRGGRRRRSSWLAQAAFGVVIAGALLFGLFWLEPQPVERWMIGSLLLGLGITFLVGVWETRCRVVAGVALLLSGVGVVFGAGFLGW